MNGLLVDDDELFARTLQRALGRRGIFTQMATSAEAALQLVKSSTFDFALVDLKIASDSGLQLIGPLKAMQPRMRVVMMSGYASVATTVEAIKRGADDYLVKPVGVESVLRALDSDVETEPKPDAGSDDAMLPLNRVEWEHIQQALRQTDGNISAAARMLGVHRRSLQRKLSKRPGN
jgi:two-component system response regulator RegA